MKFEKRVVSAWFYPVILAALVGLDVTAPTATAQGYFYNRADYATGTAPMCVVTGDFNGDGIPDLAVVNWQANTVSILLGRVNGSFGPKTDFPAGNSPTAAVTGDFNRDGKLDLAITGSGVVLVLLGRGDGSFDAPFDYSVGAGPNWIVAGDFNSDGNLDIAVSNAGGGTVSVLLGNGDGTFKAQQTFDTGTEPGGIIAADVNQDGILDLITANGNCPAGTCGQGSVSVLLGKGDGTFQTHADYAVGTFPESVAAADFNGDGKLDLAVSNAESPSISILLGSGDGTFQAHQDFSTDSASGPIEAADVNGDGKPDLLFPDNPASGVAVFLGNGDGTFKPARIYAAGSYPSSVAIADLNGDGKIDLAVSNQYSNSVTVLLGNGDGTFSPGVNLPQASSDTGQTAESLGAVIGDFNGDGIPDLAITEGDSVGDISVLLGKGGGSFQPPINTPSGAAGAIVAADFNRDGKLDVAFADINGTAVALGNGDGTFGAPLRVVTSAAAVPAGGVLAGDFNNDGKQDLVVLQNGFLTPNPIFVLLGNGDGTFQPAKQFGGSSLVAEGIAAGDFNRDGKLDLAIAVNGGGIGVMLGNGDGTFQNPVMYATDEAPGGLTVADLNGDGIPDIVAIARKVDVFLGKGNGTFAPAVTYSPGAYPYAVATGDFNADGKIDVALATFGSVSALSVLFGNGDGTLQPPVLISASGIPFSLTVGDLNGDGIADLVFPSNPGFIFFSTPIATLFPTSLNFGAIASGSLSSPQAVTLTNNGIAPLVLRGATATEEYTVSNGCGDSVAKGATCSLEIAFAPTTLGPVLGALTLSDNAESSPQVIALKGTGSNQDFTLTMPTGSSSTASINPGQAATYSLNLGETGGFNQTVNFTCTGAPSEATCSVSPSSAAPSASGPVAITVTVTTTAPTLVVPNPRRTPPLGSGMDVRIIAWLLLGSLTLTSLAFRFVGGQTRSRKLGWAFRMAAFAVLVFAMTACGGGGGGGGGTYDAGTPAGTYTLTVTGAASGSDNLQHSMTLTLKVD